MVGDSLAVWHFGKLNVQVLPGGLACRSIQIDPSQSVFKEGHPEQSEGYPIVQERFFTFVQNDSYQKTLQRRGWAIVRAPIAGERFFEAL